MNLKIKNHSGTTVFSVLLLLVFTLFTLMLAGTGAAVYKNSTAYLNENYTSRTAIAYISEKVRQHNSTGNIFFSDVEGSSALVLRDTMEEGVFLTYIYYYDGALCELFVHEDTPPKASGGSRIVTLEKLEITESDHIISVTAVSPNGNTLSMVIHSC